MPARKLQPFLNSRTVPDSLFLSPAIVVFITRAAASNAWHATNGSAVLVAIPLRPIL
jgi:hypothetical protein